MSDVPGYLVPKRRFELDPGPGELPGVRWCDVETDLFNADDCITLIGRQPEPRGRLQR